MISRGHDDGRVDPAHLRNRKGVASLMEGGLTGPDCRRGLSGTVKGWTSLDLVWGLWEMSHTTQRPRQVGSAPGQLFTGSSGPQCKGNMGAEENLNFPVRPASFISKDTEDGAQVHRPIEGHMFEIHTSPTTLSRF